MNSAMGFQEECLICSEELKKNVDLDTEIILYECDHVFHKMCLLRWILEVHMKSPPRPFSETPKNERAMCPKCRKALSVEDYLMLEIVEYKPMQGYAIPCWAHVDDEAA